MTTLPFTRRVLLDGIEPGWVLREFPGSTLVAFDGAGETCDELRARPYESWAPVSGCTLLVESERLVEVGA